MGITILELNLMIIKRMQWSHYGDGKKLMKMICFDQKKAGKKQNMCECGCGCNHQKIEVRAEVGAE